MEVIEDIPLSLESVTDKFIVILKVNLLHIKTMLLRNKLMLIILLKISFFIKKMFNVVFGEKFYFVEKILVFKGFLFLVSSTSVFVILEFTKIIILGLIFDCLYFWSSSVKIKVCGVGR